MVRREHCITCDGAGFIWIYENGKWIQCSCTKCHGRGYIERKK